MDKKQIIKQSEEHAKKVGIKLNPDKAKVNEIVEGLLKKQEKYGEIYCPCRIVTGNKEKDKEIICPCVFHRGEVELQGHCLCYLFLR